MDMCAFHRENKSTDITGDTVRNFGVLHTRWLSHKADVVRETHLGWGPHVACLWEVKSGNIKKMSIDCWESQRPSTNIPSNWVKRPVYPSFVSTCPTTKETTTPVELMTSSLLSRKMVLLHSELSWTLCSFQPLINSYYPALLLRHPGCSQPWWFIHSFNPYGYPLSAGP